MKFASISFSLDLGSCAEATIAFVSLINSVLTLVLTLSVFAEEYVNEMYKFCQQ